jgi:hypothetical protein
MNPMMDCPSDFEQVLGSTLQSGLDWLMPDETTSVRYNPFIAIRAILLPSRNHDLTTTLDVNFLRCKYDMRLCSATLCIRKSWLFLA